ncbi:hypothetical protein NLU13_7088 [Sarocladium strictum]|uniref:CENP-C homolog n=1 Tax=Sarocladium strictum TaxID=5046 RepID=A0AA39GEL6_SARSR|nr:hypothetical protein NLU13_7088 [Sarocladium strictum]
MAPRAGGRRTGSVEPQAFYEIGKQGRKTGVVLPDGGQRDEHGMQPLDDIFSSPRKSRGSSSARSDRTRDETGSEDMDIASSGGPGPRTLLKERSIQYPIPRSRSPLKTSLKSPAKKNPHMSSPERTVTRKIDFAAKNAGPRHRQPSRANGINGTRHVVEEVEEEEEADDDEVEFGEHPATDDMINESLRVAEEMGADYDEDLPMVGDEQDDEERLFAPRSGGSAKKKNSQRRPVSREEEIVEEDGEDEEEEQSEPEVELPPPRKPGRPAKKDTKSQALAKARAAKKRPSLPDEEEPETADAGQVEANDDERRRPKKQKTTAASTKSGRGKAASAASAATKPAAKPGRPRGRPKKVLEVDDGEVGDTSIAALQRGPPMPKARGLVSVRHEEGMKQTRSGRHSYRPLAFWRGEAAVAEREDYDDMFQKDRHFVLPSIKEVVRVEPDVAPSKRAPRSKSRAKTKSKSTAAQEEDEELEEWETNPGTVTGEVVLWEPEHERHPPAEDEPVHIIEEQIAISGDAVQTRETKDATFKFAKTLTMPFIGAGVLDLPVGGEKRPKNSRKMHMVFFVHYGKVLVTVNEAQFRISPGGTWFVPRGNYYSITNDYDNPARIFFAQACEVPAQPVELAEE